MVLMVWVKLDDQFASDPKILDVGPLGLAMQVAALCYCNRHLTDGHLPAAAPATLLVFDGIGVYSGQRGEDVTAAIVVADLVEVGMWHEPDHDCDECPQISRGYYLHGYLDYQPSKADVEAEREQKRAAGRAGGRASAKARAQAAAKARAQAEPQAESKPVPVPVPKSKPLADADAPAGKPRDDLFEEVAQQCGINWRNGLTKSERGELNNAVKQLRDVGATAVQVKARSASYRRKWPNVDLTPSALVKHWSKVDSRPPPDQGKAPEYDHDDAEARFRALTGGGN